MLKTLIRRELLDNLMTFRFAAVLLITLLLVVANSAVLIQDYEQRLESYNDAVKMHQQVLHNSKTYSTAYLDVDRAPNPLSIFNVGLDKRLGNLVGIYHGFMPTLWDARMHGTDNPFIAFFSSIDIVFVFEVIRIGRIRRVFMLLGFRRVCRRNLSIRRRFLNLKIGLASAAILMQSRRIYCCWCCFLGCLCWARTSLLYGLRFE